MATHQRLDNGIMASAFSSGKQNYVRFLLAQYGIPRGDASLYHHADRTL